MPEPLSTLYCICPATSELSSHSIGCEGHILLCEILGFFQVHRKSVPHHLDNLNLSRRIDEVFQRLATVVFPVLVNEISFVVGEAFSFICRTLAVSRSARKAIKSRLSRESSESQMVSICCMDISIVICIIFLLCDTYNIRNARKSVNTFLNLRG